MENERSDEELIRAVLAGHIDAYGTLIRRYERLVFAVAYDYLRNAEDARDASQDVWVRAYTRLGQLRDASRFVAWIRQLAQNEALAHLSRRERHRALSVEDRVVSMVSVHDRIDLESALDSLPERSRLTVVLYYLHAHSLREIAALLGEPESTIKSRLRNARAKMRRSLEDALENELGPNAMPDDFANRVTDLITAARLGDATTLSRLLRADSGLIRATEEPSGMTALHVAAAAGHAALVELLLSQGADPNAHDKGDNASPLHYASERGRRDVVELLVEAGSDVNWNQDVHERGPLGWATVFGLQRDVAEYLLAHGARHDIFSAVAMDDEQAVRRLIAEDPSCVDARRSECDHRVSVVTFAATTGRATLGNLLIESGARVGLEEAASLGRIDDLKRLLADGADGTTMDRAFVAAAKARQHEALRLLAAAGANPDAAPYGCSAIFDATEGHDRETAELLLELGANLEWDGNYWHSTALGYRVFFGDPVGVELAMSLGAKVAPTLVDLARAGERGELRQWSLGTPEGYRQVLTLLSA